MKIREYDLEDYMNRFVEAIKGDYPVKIISPLQEEGSDFFLFAVENPKFQEDNGEDEYLVIEVKCGC